MNDILTVNNYFDQVYVLNLDRRPDRMENISNKLEKLNIKFKRFSAIDGMYLKDIKAVKGLINNKFALGCLFSHIEIIKDAKKNNYKSILILEDDIMFSEKFNEYFQKIKDINDWEMIYLGASETDLSEKYNWDFVEIKNGFYKTSAKTCTVGAFAYAVNCNIYDKILNGFNSDVYKNIKRAIDLIYLSRIHPNEKCYVFYPNIIIADVSDSNIRGPRDVDLQKIKMRWNLLDDYF